MPGRGQGIYREWRVGVIVGGLSAEREVSLMTGREVVKALRGRGYQVISVEAKRDLPLRLCRHKVEVVFNALHGKVGEDGCVQGLLEVMGLPYTGSGVTASALSMDKVLAKDLFVRKGISTPPYQVLQKSHGPAEVRLSLPLVVKPRSEGSTLGVTIVRRKKDLSLALARAFRFGPTCLVERYIAGKEIAVGVLDGRALGAIEIRPLKGFYDFKTKYTSGLARHLYPAPLKKQVYRRVMRVAEEACAVLGCEGTPRVDLRVTSQGRAYVLEVNTLPGLTPLSLLPEIARGQGISFPDLVEKILDRARLKTAISQ